MPILLDWMPLEDITRRMLRSKVLVHGEAIDTATHDWHGVVESVDGTKVIIRKGGLENGHTRQVDLANVSFLWILEDNFA